MASLFEEQEEADVNAHIQDVGLISHMLTDCLDVITS